MNVIDLIQFYNSIVLRNETKQNKTKIETNINLNFTGALALVTGGGSGIGRAVCQLLAREKVNVVAGDLNQATVAETIDQLTKNGSSDLNHLAVSLDVSDRKSVEDVFNQIKTHYNGKSLNILVNCAGITRDAQLVKMTDEKFDEVIDVNLKGTFIASQLACKNMIEGKVPWGSIVNVSSTSGKYGNFGQVNYAASKAGVIGMTKSIAKEMAKNNIRCNCVVPGFIDTPMVKTVPEHILAMVEAITALGRKGHPIEVAEAIVFLATPRSSFITGESIDVTGGMFM